MTETLSRPARPSQPPRRRPAGRTPSLLRAGLRTAVPVAAAGLLAVTLPLLLVWATDPRAGGGVGDALRTAGQLWLLAHGGSFDLADGAFALTPLGLVGLPLLLLARSSRRRGEQHRLRSVGVAVSFSLVTGGVYAALALVVAMLSATADVLPDLLSVALGAASVGFTGCLAGALGVDRLWRAAWLPVRPSARRTLRAAAVASACLVAAGAVLAGVSLAVHGSRAADLAGVSDPGPVGGVALLALGLVLVPNAAVWAGSWLAGPGFAVGVGTAVGPFGSEVGPVPALPLLAAVPAGGVPGWVGALALVVPVLAGALAGRLVLRDLSDAGPWRSVGAAASVGPVAGTAWALLAWLSGGAVGGARLAEVGPAPWAVGLAVTVLVGAGAVLLVAARLLRARTRPGQPA